MINKTLYDSIAHSAEWTERLLKWASETPERQALCEKISELRKIVSNNLNNFRSIFPEFTPHDIHLHADRIMRMANSIIEPNVSQLNVTEYLVFTTAIFTHDWGMAVNDEEKAVIKSLLRCDNAPSCYNREIPALIQNEVTHLRNFILNKHNVSQICDEIDLANNEWADYLRITHGQRSGSRLRTYFKETHHRFGEYVALVAEGHTATEERIADNSIYLTNAAPVYDDKPLNVQAIAVYLRLIDLFDISDERTPYSLWRFINPQNQNSKVEWAKHLSLAPVHIDKKTGALVFQGEVSDADVWARVCDLRIYCEQQFTFSRNLLNKRSEKQYYLPFHWLDWDNVSTKGIPKDLIRFEFDRDTIFNILSEEVYNKDPYVFIRELLQNAIDAMETRKRVLIQRNADTHTFSPIEIHCNSTSEGDYTFTIKDYGTGMDHYIIRNYLAIAGKSFYRSSDLLKLGIEYDAISRFGIGLLSCFMVADSIEIITHGDPYIFPAAKTIRLRISNMKSHWTITESDPTDASVGTTVRVNILAQKVIALNRERSDIIFEKWNLARSQLGITQYLKIIAGFVRFPILVSENDNKTVILHPDYDDNLLPSKIHREYHIHKLKQDYDLSRAVTPGSIEKASRFFQVETLRMKQDLNLEKVEGSISFLVPVNQSFLLTDHEKTNLNSNHGIQFYSHDGGFINRRTMSLCDSAAQDRHVACFSNGIFIPDVTYPPQLWEMSTINTRHEDKCGTWALNGVQLFLNLKHRHLNAPRTRLTDDEASWANAALSATGKYYVTRWRDELLACSPLQRLRLLCRYSQLYPVSLSLIANSIGVDNWPVCFLTTDGCIEVFDWKTVDYDTIATVPESLQNACGSEIEGLLRNKDTLRIPWLKFWNGPPLLVGPMSKWIGCSHYAPLVSMPLIKNGYIQKTQWATPPFANLPPILLKVWTPLEKDKHEKCETGKLTREEMKKKAKGWCNFDHNDDHRYPSSFDNYCFWGHNIVNSRHPLGSALIDVILLTQKCSDLYSETTAGEHIMNWFSSLFLESVMGSNGYNCIDYSMLNQKLTILAGIITPHASSLAQKLKSYIISREDFLPGAFLCQQDGTIKHINYGEHCQSQSIPLLDIVQQEGIQSWGRLLDWNTQWPTWKDLDKWTEISSIE